MRILTKAASLKARAMLALAYGCGLRASKVARLRACDVDSDQMIISGRAVEGPQGPERDAAARDSRPVVATVEGAAETARRQRAPEQRWLFPVATVIYYAPVCRLFKDAAKAAAEQGGLASGSKG